jgi:hypothetical protein
MSKTERVIQFRFFEDNPNVVKECQGWLPWETIEEEGKIAEIREYIALGKQYQIRVLTQTHLEGLELMYICTSPSVIGPVREEQIVPGLDAIRNYLVRHDLISGSSNELGFTLVDGAKFGRFWAKCTYVCFQGKPQVQLGHKIDDLKPLLNRYTSSKWRDHLTTVFAELP